MALFGKILSTAGLLLLSGTPLLAQATATTGCQVDAGKGNLAKASFSFEQARAQFNTPAASASLASTVRALEAATGEDTVAQALYLGQTLSLWTSQAAVGMNPTRKSLGFTRNPDAPLDIVLTIDSLFTVVETAKPACADAASQYRTNQAYVNLIQGGFAALQADKLDSAELMGSKAVRLVKGSPHGNALLASIATKRNDTPKAISYWNLAAVGAARDTSLRDLQLQALGSAGVANLNVSLAATGAAQVDAARAAAKQYQEILAIPGQKPDDMRANRQNYQLALRLAGDTAGVVASYQPLIANPSGYSYRELYESAFNAARMGRAADVPRLMEASLTQNPYNRDALYFLAVGYLDAAQHEKVPATVARLVALDPSGVTNYDVAMNSYLARQTAQKSKTTPIAKALYDSATVWHDRGQKLTADVAMDQYTVTEKGIAVEATVTDKRGGPATTTSTAGRKVAARPAASASRATKVVTLNFEALDKDGKVVGTRSITTEPLAPGAKGRISVTIDAANAVGYRYTVAP